MARKKPNGEPVQAMENYKLPVPQPPADPPLEKTKPVMNWKWSTSRGTIVEVSVWEFETVLDDGQVVTNYTITNHRSYRDQQGNWSPKTGHFRLVDLATLIFGLTKAHEWIMAKRDLSQPDF